MYTNKLHYLFILLFINTYLSAFNIIVPQNSYEKVKEKIETHAIKKSSDKILEIYFDLPELKYLNSNGFIKYEAIQYKTKKGKIKYKENIKYSLDGKIVNIYSVKHYNNIKSLKEKNQLLSLIKRKERKLFLDALKKDGIKHPMRIKKIIQVSKIVNTFTINTKTIQISKTKVSALNKEIQFILLSANDKNLVNEISMNFKLKTQNIEKNEYRISFEEMEKNTIFFTWMIEHPTYVNLFYSVFYATIGLFIIFYLFRRRLISK